MAEPAEPAEPYVFLSYTSRDRARVFALADRLEAAGIRVWVDRRELVGGSSWNASIVDAIAHCTVFALTCSARSLVSPNVQQEVQLAWEEQRPLLPLLLEPVPIPRELRYPLAGRQWVELLERPEADWLPEVLRALAGLGLTPASMQTAAAASPGEPAAMHLPVPLTSFIGREQELAEVITLLGTTRLLTLSGPGGTGKTRLSIAAAQQVADRFPDGVWFVDLSGVADPAGVLPAIAQVLDVRESEGRSLAVSLAAYLRRKRLLLVLDNFEQVVVAAMSLYDLLAEAPGLSLLVTSRVLLHVESEREYAVPPLPLPEAGAAVPEQVGGNPSVQLFVERALAHRAGFRLSSDNAASVAAICRRLDGLPLAIELAAARVKLLPPVQLLARLEQRLAFLTGGERNRPTRQQTLRNTIRWSWDLLGSAEQVLFRRLTVFAGGFTLEAVEAVCNASGELDVLEGLAALVDQSLVRQGEVNDEPRFSLLATLQEFALEQLEAAGEGEALRRGHAVYYTMVADEAAEAWWRSGRLQKDLLRPLDPERDNLFLALGWVLAEQDAEIGLRLGGPLGAWCYIRAPGEGRRLAERLLGLPGAAAPSAAQGRVLFAAAACAVQQGEWQTAVGYYEAAAASARVAEDLQFVSMALGCAAAFVPEADRAQALAEEALGVARKTGSAFTLAFVEQVVGMTPLWHSGNSAVARGHLDEALRLARVLQADWLTVATLSSLGTLTAVEGQHEEARALSHEVLLLVQAVGDRMAATTTHMQLAQLAATANDQREVAAHWQRALLLAQELGSGSATALCLTGIAALPRVRQQFGQAVRLLAASDWKRQAGEQHPFLGPHFQTAFEETLVATKAALSPAAFAQAWAAGLALSPDQATDLALAELASLARAASPPDVGVCG